MSGYPSLAYSPPAPLRQETIELIRRARVAAFRVRALFPGPVGEVLFQELDALIDHGHRFEVNGRSKALIDDILARQYPPPLKTKITAKVSAPRDGGVPAA